MYVKIIGMMRGIASEKLIKCFKLRYLEETWYTWMVEMDKIGALSRPQDAVKQDILFDRFSESKAFFIT